MLAVIYLLIVALFYFDGWYHTFTTRDVFWLIPRGILLLVVAVHAVLPWILYFGLPAQDKSAHFLKWYGIGAVVLFLGLFGDGTWQPYIQPLAPVSEYFFRIPHIFVILPLLVLPFLAYRIDQRYITGVIFFASLLAFVYYVLLPFSLSTRDPLFGIYGQLAAVFLMSFVFFFVLLSYGMGEMHGLLLTLLFLSLVALVTRGRPLESLYLFGSFNTLTEFPFLLTFFSFVVGALSVDIWFSIRRCLNEYAGFLWGALQAGIYYAGVKLWLDFAITKTYFAQSFSWTEVAVITILGALGGAAGYAVAEYVVVRWVKEERWG